MPRSKRHLISHFTLPLAQKEKTRKACLNFRRLCTFLLHIREIFDSGILPVLRSGLVNREHLLRRNIILDVVNLCEDIAAARREVPVAANLTVLYSSFPVL